MDHKGPENPRNRFARPARFMDMDRHVLVAMDRTKASEDALEYAFEEHSDATISVIHVTESSDPLGLFGDRDPSEYMFPEYDFELDDEMVPNESRFTRAQRKRAEHVFTQACALATTHNEEIELVVKSGSRHKLV